LKQLEAALGQAYKERDDYKRQVDDLRYQLNYGKAFNGDSKALLTATYRAEYYPSQEQLYAAKTLLEKEYPSNAPGQYQLDENGKVVVFLPDNRGDSQGLHGDDPNREWITQQLDRLAKEEHRQFDAQLHAWIAEGKLHEECALLCRSQWFEPDHDAEWAPGGSANPVPAAYVALPVSEGKSEKFSVLPPAFAANGKDQDLPAKPPAGFVVLFTRPFACFQVTSGTRYEADSGGEVLVDEAEAEDVEDLLRAGCRSRR
jgi:hypothetical protein